MGFPTLFPLLVILMRALEVFSGGVPVNGQHCVQPKPPGHAAERAQRALNLFCIHTPLRAKSTSAVARGVLSVLSVNPARSPPQDRRTARLPHNQIFVAQRAAGEAKTFETLLVTIAIGVGL